MPLLGAPLGLVTVASHQPPSKVQCEKVPVEKSNVVDAAPEMDLCAMEPSVMRRPPKWQHESRIRNCIQNAVRGVGAAAADALTRDAQLRGRDEGSVRDPAWRYNWQEVGSVSDFRDLRRHDMVK